MSIDDIVVVDVLFVRVLLRELHHDLLCIILRVCLHHKGGEVEELMILDGLGEGIPDPYEVAVFARDTADHIKETPLHIYLEHLEVADSDHVVAHVAGHLLVLEDLAGIGALAGGA